MESPYRGILKNLDEGKELSWRGKKISEMSESELRVAFVQTARENLRLMAEADERAFRSIEGMRK